MGICLAKRKRVERADVTDAVRAKLNYSSLFWLFLGGSVCGFVLEGLWSVLRLGVWEDHSATLWGPFCIIYGFGAVAMYSAYAVLQGQAYRVQFAAYALLGSLLEFVGSWLQERVFGTVSWDYSGHFLNVGGRISLQMTLIWGALGVLFARFVFPHLTRALPYAKRPPLRILCVFLSVFMALNLTVTAAAILRWRERQSDASPSNAVEAFLDATCDDDRMQSVFSNMQFR